MELVYTLKGLDCPHCSAKIEHDVAELEEVSAASVNLMQQTLTVETPHPHETVGALIERIVHKHEPDVEVIAPAAGQSKPLHFTLEGLDCPNCAAKIEAAAAKLEGVSEAKINLMTQTLTLRVSGADRDALTAQVEEVVHQFEPEVAVKAGAGHAHSHAHSHEHGECCDHDHDHAHEHDHEHEHEHEHEHGYAHEHDHAHDHAHEHEHTHHHDENRTMLWRLLIGAGVFAVGAVLHYALHAPKAAVFCIMLLAYVILGWDVVWKALRNIARGQVFDEHFLMTIATLGAFALGETPEAAAVMLFYQTGEYFQSLAVQRSRRSISSLLDIRPDTANLLHDGEAVETHAEDVPVGALILVKAGERVPLDGVVTAGESMLDTSALTGESVPRRAAPGDTVLSGCINQSGALTLRVTKAFDESTAAKIIDMVENASARKAPTENFITTFARYYTPVVVISALLLAIVPPLLFGGVWAEWIRRALVFLIVSCPCALVISIPLTFFGGIGAASKHGVLVKGSNYLEALSRVRSLVFDKTGTLTKGEFSVTEIIPAEGVSADEVLRAAACCEQNSNHPIADSIRAAFSGDAAALSVSESEEISGRGIRAVSEGKTLLAGSAKLMEDNGIAFTPCSKAGTKVYAAQDGRFLGCILIADSLKADSADTVAALREAGIDTLTMLTGDDEAIAKSVADTLGLDGYAAQLLPEQKVTELEKLMQTMPEGEKLAFVGDGINDAPVLARADVGIAMGALGADAAIEAADIVLMTDEPARLTDAITVARETKRIVMQNIVFALGIKLLLLILGACGIAGMWAAVFGDVGVTVIAVLNAMRMLRK